MDHNQIVSLLGEEAEYLLNYQCQKIPQEKIYHPHANSVQDIFGNSDRSAAVIDNLKRLYETGRLANSGYLYIFPIDQGVEHTAAYSFYQNPDYFDPEQVLITAIEGGASAITAPLGMLGLVSNKYADKIPFIVKVTHNEMMTYPNQHHQVPFATARQAKEMGAVGVGATVYFGSNMATAEIQVVSKIFTKAHQLGLFTVLWCYPRNDAYNREDGDYNQAIDLTAQAIHLGVTMEADIIKQKFPTAHRGFPALHYSKFADDMYDALLTDHPIDLLRYQVLHAYSGRIPVINSGGEASGEDDLRTAIRTAVINKRGGGSGLIMGRKVFKKSRQEGIVLMQAVMDVYLDKEITVA